MRLPKLHLDPGFQHGAQDGQRNSQQSACTAYPSHPTLSNLSVEEENPIEEGVQEQTRYRAHKGFEGSTTQEHDQAVQN